MSRKNPIIRFKGSGNEYEPMSRKNKLFSILLAILVIPYAIEYRVNYSWSMEIYVPKIETINLNMDRVIINRFRETLNIIEKTHEIELWISNFRYWQNTIQEKFVMYDYN